MSKEESATQNPPSYNSSPVEAKCHCGATTVTLPSPPKLLNECQCSICYRYGVYWAYYPRDQVLVTTESDVPTQEPYVWGDKTVEFHRCGKCGCVTHWWAIDTSDPSTDMGVNCRMLDKAVIEGVEIEKDPGPP